MGQTTKTTREMSKESISGAIQLVHAMCQQQQHTTSAWPSLILLLLAIDRHRVCVDDRMRFVARERASAAHHHPNMSIQARCDGFRQGEKGSAVRPPHWVWVALSIELN